METTQKIFDAITDFVSDLHMVFGEEYKNVTLYKYLLDKTTHQNVVPVQKHVEVFRTFVNGNADAIERKDASLLAQPVVLYSERVFIDVGDLLSKCTKETSNAVWNHILAINAHINPSEKALVLLKESVESSGNNDSDDFLQDIINTVTSSVDPNTGGDPMMIAMNLMSSGKLSSIISNMTTKFNDGSINPDDLLKRVTTMYTDMTAGDETAPDISSIISTFGGVSGMTADTKAEDCESN